MVAIGPNCVVCQFCKNNGITALSKRPTEAPIIKADKTNLACDLLSFPDPFGSNNKFLAINEKSTKTTKRYSHRNCPTEKDNFSFTSLTFPAIKFVEEAISATVLITLSPINSIVLEVLFTGKK
jgi:hypothetical protein